MGRVRALSLVSCVRAGAGAVACVMCGVWWCRGVVLNARVGELPGGCRFAPARVDLTAGGSGGFRRSTARCRACCPL